MSGDKTQFEVKAGSIPSPNSDREAQQHDAAFVKKVLRKIDFWLVGFYSFVYIFRVIDSSNCSNAAIVNLGTGSNIKKQLHLSPAQWAWTLSIFSYSYLLFEPSNTLLLKKFKPSRWMFILMLSWGVCASCVGAVQNYKSMLVVRFALGMAEAGFYPSVLYHMSFWYKPQEMWWRIATFYSVGQIAGAVSGLLAYIIGFMNGAGNLAGWRWLFILEGLPSILLSFVALIWLPDYPQTAKLLSEEEKAFVLHRLAATAPSGDHGKWDWGSLLVLFSDPTTYTFALYWVAHGIGGFGVSFALPTVIYQLGFTSTSKSQLMNIPPYVACFFFLNTLGWLLHEKYIRAWTTAVAIEATIIICYILLITVKDTTVKYLCLVVAVSCAGSAYPVIWPERIRALEGTVSAGIGIGLTNAMAQFGGIAGPHVYSTVFGPKYHESYVVCLSLLVVAILSILASWWLVSRKDRVRAELANASESE